MAAPLSRTSAANTMRALKRGVVFELLIAGLDLFAGQGAETVHPELFAAEAAHHGAVDHGAAQFGKVEIAARGSVAAAEQNGAVLAALDYQRVRTHVHNFGGGAAQVVLARKQAGFAVVDQQEVPL